ncbi:hypothetical protein RFI_20134 [Reticulomyxa filosa]|uniref:Uncharacterized protein n=1 Tax=Reticulomyxa filosa TaxID=46433 RepID=X6MU47_RETFI|nr:hypothetical protein RFI_20134 [Reticulomyxa filosa]|eukprot:ETO17196.1 hypothetical protein RFI_20134 [Reticulomyxa filosa]
MLFFIEKIDHLHEFLNINNQAFQNLKKLRIPLSQSQCMLHKHEILICGGRSESACYSYHTIKNEYKFVCKYPIHIKLEGHCVVKLVDKNKDSNQITLLSFGSVYTKGHTLVMKYVSVWDNISSNSNEFDNYNEWIPFTDNHNRTIVIGRD